MGLEPFPERAWCSGCQRPSTPPRLVEVALESGVNGAGPPWAGLGGRRRVARAEALAQALPPIVLVEVRAREHVRLRALERLVVINDVPYESAIITPYVWTHERGEIVSRVAVFDDDDRGPIGHGADLAHAGDVVEGLDYDAHHHTTLRLIVRVYRPGQSILFQ